MLLIHLSDIHLKESDFNSEMDRNQNLRRKLIEDANNFCKRIGKKPSTIIVSGDIAYSGKTKEYEFADKWLNDLCQQTGAEFDNIFVIPGNHDIDRGAIKGKVPSALQSELRNLSEPDLENKIRGFIEDEGSAAILLSPLLKFNEFAKKFSCEFNIGRNTLVKKNIKINDSYNLVIWGLNSVLVSNGDDSKNPGNMILAPSYHSIFSEDGAINIVTCHHPFNWILNGEYFKTQVESNAHLLLFGHEHNNRFLQAKNYLQVSSSAVIPDEDGSGTLPGYNIFDINIEEDDGKDYLVIKLYLREWQFNPDAFREKVGQSGEPVIISRFEVRKNSNTPFPLSPSISKLKDNVFDVKKSAPPPSSNDEDLISSVMTHPHDYDMDYFLSLNLINKKKVASECGLWDEGYNDFTSQELTIEIIKSAIKQNKLSELLHLSKIQGI